MKVPFVDLKSQYETIRFEVAAAIQKVLEDTAFSAGPYVARFEKEFAQFCGTRHAIGVGSGTSAIWLALQACGIGPGDEVITVPNTFIATAEAISFAGAKPVFVDIDEGSYLMNPDLLDQAVSLRTKAIIPVHLFGQMVDMDPVMDFAKDHGLYVIEDACQAHGATYKGRKAGSIGDAGCFSFYPGKNLGAYGEGGAVVTNSDRVAERVRILRDHGQSKKYYHSVIGWNDRMDGIQGAVLSVKLKYLEDWNEARRQNAHLYSSLLGEVDDIQTPVEKGHGEHVYHLYVVRVPGRDDLIRHLAEKDIFCGIHYPIPIHLQDAYHFLGLEKGRYPVTEKCAAEMVSLPMFAELTREQIDYVTEEIKTYLSRRVAGRQGGEGRPLSAATA
ncbi:MAG: dTDP-3-amino-3,6-dideoxy-alpha-D-galactopyranose transaminase [Syntrophorhabdaceae bacterium PtaU1.Bin034]|jgi:dTDP-4-amino-4,6-dideoxygalactose transaminase|nr:MAG: dTDP-3-amino-3,6-dideoxy-alpha-D-galactopyranose transaminase [Syntrophorhabdaceae bacterium PtaU1.Bin034]